MSVTFHLLGDEAMVVQFEQKIDPKINRQVVQLCDYVEQELHKVVRYVIPAYNSLTIVFDKSKIQISTIEDFVKTKLKPHQQQKKIPERKLYIPVCYDKSFATDLEEVCRQTQLSTTEVIRMHSSSIYRTYMIGFLPGFPYFGKLHRALSCERKSKPEMKMPVGAVGIAGLQTGIYPQSSPGGWQVIGRTPLPIIGISEAKPFLFQQGDEVQFYSIAKSQFRTMHKSVTAKTFNWDSIYG
jgi:inhibitor of KinA